MGGFALQHRDGCFAGRSLGGGLLIRCKTLSWVLYVWSELVFITLLRGGSVAIDVAGPPITRQVTDHAPGDRVTRQVTSGYLGGDTYDTK